MSRISYNVFWREKGDSRGDGALFKAPLEFDAAGQPFVILHNWLKNGKPLFDQKIREYVDNANWKCLQKCLFLKTGNRVDGRTGKRDSQLKPVAVLT
jgi:hypothetical protein